MANVKNIGNIDFQNAYNTSFGALPHGTCYQKADLKSLNTDKATFEVDMREQLSNTFASGIASLKAHSSTAGGVGTAGYGMIPVYVDNKLIDESRKNTPAVSVIPRVTNMGMTADYNVIVSKGGAFVAAEDGALSETDTVYDRKSTAIKYLYAVGRVTGQSNAGQPAYMMAGFQAGTSAVSDFGGVQAQNALQMETIVKAREMKELEENLIINGNVSSDANEFNGIVTIMGSTNTVDKSTSAITLADIDTAVQSAFDDGGRPNFAICSSAVFTDIKALLQAKIGFLQSSVSTSWGFSSISLNTIVGDIPLVPSMFLSNTSGSKSVYFLDLSVVEMRVLQDMTYEKLAKTNDSDKFFLKIYEALIIRAPSFCASVTAIA